MNILKGVHLHTYSRQEKRKVATEANSQTDCETIQYEG